MRFVAVFVACSLAPFAASAANAAVPNSIAALLGPSVGYLMAQNDLCGWSLGDKIEKTYQNSFKAVGMTDAQQATAWQQAKTTQTNLANIPAEAKTRMKADTCTDASRARLEKDLAD